MNTKNLFGFVKNLAYSATVVSVASVMTKATLSLAEKAKAKWDNYSKQ